MEDTAEQRITSINPPLLPDYNRDGRVNTRDAMDHANSRMMYFWTNHDTWRGDDAFAGYSGGWHVSPMTLPDNGEDNVVNGRNDLVNLCPFAVDLTPFVNAWGIGQVKYELEVEGPGKVRFVPIRTKWKELGEIVVKSQATVSGGSLHSATLNVLLDSDNNVSYELPSGLVTLGESKAGALAVEFNAAGLHRFRIVVRDRASGTELFRSSTEAYALDVHNMYRWINLELECGEITNIEYVDRYYSDWPDGDSSDANVVFVHGYNMHPDEAWDWSQAMFKRLWWTGMDARFTAVLWRGNETQMWIPSENCFATRNYHQNVLNAFRTANMFAFRVNNLPGTRKYIIAHSLGNMLVSAARQFYGLNYEKFFMLNAAVAVEAYDPVDGVTAESKADMTPSEWRAYSDSVRSTHWHELFDQTDERRKLTWKGVFANVDNTVNFYSSHDEVVANGSDKVKKVLSREFAWYNQEQKKGVHLVSFSPQAGWGFNGYYTHQIGWGPGTTSQPYTPAEAAAIPLEMLKVHPFFKSFSDGELQSEGGSAFLAVRPSVFWRALSHGIPAESFSAGANRVPKWGGSNVDMAKQCVPDSRVELPWIHSYFIQNSLFDTRVLYEKLVQTIGTTKLKEEE